MSGRHRPHASLHRIGRRTFLHDLGRGTVAVAVLGTTTIACGGDDSDAAPDRSPGSEPTAGFGSEATVAPDTGTEDAAMRWERVELGFVSAYVIARGTTAALVDTGTEGSEDALLAGLGVLGLGWGDVGHVILTHSHGDHRGSLAAVLDASPAAVAHAGAADVAAITGVDVSPLEDGDEVFGLQVIATPGHTPGHISVFDPVARFLVAGDALNGADGAVAGPNPDFSADHDLALAQVARLADLDVDTVVFGHGDPVLTGARRAIAAASGG